MLLKSIFSDLGKQYKLPTPLKRHMSGLALQGLIFWGGVGGGGGGRWGGRGRVGGSEWM